MSTNRAQLRADEIKAQRQAEQRAAEPAKINGMCTACGAVEVALVKQTGTRDLSALGEHAAYPTGYGCEACS